MSSETGEVMRAGKQRGLRSVPGAAIDAPARTRCRSGEALQVDRGEHLVPREQRPRIALAPHLDVVVVGSGHLVGVEILVARDVAQCGQLRAQPAQQGDKPIDLRIGIRLGHRLPSRIQPVGPASAVDEFDPDRARVVAARVVGDAVDVDVAVHRAVAVDVEVSAVAGVRHRIQHALAVLARSGEVGQFGAVDDDEIDLRERPPVQLRHVGQRFVQHDEVGVHGPDASIAGCLRCRPTPNSPA
jgi:hypothetical protein